ncbi:ABC transporter ATP-binding protein [Rhodococcus opacus]|uniref:ABC transporter ATP-binding protein n=1 Tax=Rhodococcus opacus TaxID=37919 RepID=UPI001C47E2BC|nr:ABC transporter ATP-binding protein [Rhodococcus opacus]MBV6759177.1 ABC transporter ATP-binding protein [Rhodococcus opacus]
MPEVVVKNLIKDFAGNRVLNDVSFTIADGEFFTLLGPSGCGKSTTLNCVAGLERPDEGFISVADIVFLDSNANVFVAPEGRDLGMVFQSYALWPHMTIGDNLALPLKLRKVPKQRRAELIADALDKVGLLHLVDRYPHQMSGGQQQRVALARALVYAPKVLLLDEPLSNLDAKLREQARSWLKRLQSEVGITTIYVTHDQDEALSLSDRIAVMSKGNMLQVGSPTEIYEKPAVAEVANFIGRCNFLDGVVTGVHGDEVVLNLTCSDQSLLVDTAFQGVTGQFGIGQKVTVAVRPERLTLADSSNGVPAGSALEGTVLETAYVGSRFEYQVRVGDVVVQAQHHHGRFTGDVTLALPADGCLIYPEATPVSDEAKQLMTVH